MHDIIITNFVASDFIKRIHIMRKKRIEIFSQPGVAVSFCEDSEAKNITIRFIKK